MIKEGMVVTECMYSDRVCHDVVRSTPNMLVLRERKAICDKKPEMVTGGFVGIVTKEAEWHTEPDEKGPVSKAYLRKDGKFHTRSCGTIIEGDHYYYDYGF
jgi:hypothetical protein